MNLVPLYEEAIQFNDYNGTVLAAGKVEVWYLGRTRLADIYSDVAGEVPLPNPFNLNDLGMQEVYVNPAFNYTLVVYDAYNSELFSVDKYIQGAGDHNTSNVVVQPSEHIGVSAWTVGDVQIYQPYIQGELGKTYHGIEPIVVNNQENKISARNIPLGVQSPLYFAEDSESACIIGMSGEYQPVTGMSGYATTGDLVDLATSVSETYQPKGDYATVDDLSGFMEESKLETADGKITGYDGTAFAGGSVDPSEFIPWSASGNFATSGDLNDKLDTTAFSTVSGDFITAVPDTYATKDFVSSSVSSKLDSTAFADVSGNFITALPEGLLNESGFEYDGDKISAYNGSAFVGQGGGGITGEYELSAGNGISIDNYPIEQKTVISVSGDYATNSDLQNVSGDITALIPSTAGLATTGDVADLAESISETYQVKGDYLTADALDNVSGNWNEVSAKLDTTAFSDVSGTFITAHQDLSNYATTASVAEKLDTTAFSDVSSTFLTSVDLTPYQLTADMTAYQPVGDYLTANALDNVSGNWNEVSAKLDTTAFSDVSGTFLTAHQDISNKLDTTAFSDVSGSFLTGVPDTYLQNTDLSTEDGKVTAISGIPLSAGGDVPEGVMVESGLEYNAVNEISGYNGSAIAQYGAEKQWIVTDDTLLTLSNSAQFAIGVNISAVQQLMGIDETELLNSTATSAFTLTEPLTGFKAVKIKLRWLDKVPDNYYDVERFTTGKLSLSWTYFDNISDASPLELVGASWTSNNGINYNLEAGFARVFGTASSGMANFTHTPRPLSIVGVGRIN